MTEERPKRQAGGGRGVGPAFGAPLIRAGTLERAGNIFEIFPGKPEYPIIQGCR